MNKTKERKPKVHPELEGLDITVNSLGKIGLDYDIDKINSFLNRKVKDKKFKGIDGLDDMYEGLSDDKK